MENHLYPEPTNRLIIRPLRESDRDDFRAMNSDPLVMRYFLTPLDDVASDAFWDRLVEHERLHGFTMWALEEKASGAFIGLCGLLNVSSSLPFGPTIEIGWRLLPAYWGRGYATEAARACLAFAFDRLGVDEVVAFTSRLNHPSRRVMEQSGMRYDPGGDFDHPKVPEGHPLRAHILYRSTAIASTDAGA